jgi:hypothetical protein
MSQRKSSAQSNIDAPAGFESQQRSADHQVSEHLANKTISRRESLKWLGLIAAGSAAALTSSLSSDVLAFSNEGESGHWPDLKLKPVSAKGYGKDPNLIVPPEIPWPLIMSEQELELTEKLCEIIAPREGNTPSAAELGVAAVINEWVSAPYQWQQRDRVSIMHVLAWINDESQHRFDLDFIELEQEQKFLIIDSIAYINQETPAQFIRPAKAFARLRSLILAAFFTTPEGMKDIGYLGNVPISGEYPGPTESAYKHLDGVLEELGLSEYSYQVCPT